MKSDHLLIILEEKIKLLGKPQQTAKDLIFDVVAEYMYHLMQIGNVPHYVLDEIETDLREETLQIYRKITYGHSSLQEYRRKKLALKSFKKSGQA